MNSELPEAQSPSDFEIEQFLRQYDNPRGLPLNYVRGYLRRDKPQLAIDVIRTYDSQFKTERSLRRVKLVLGILNAVLGIIAAALALVKFL